MTDQLDYVLNSLAWSVTGLIIGLLIGYMVGVRRKLERIQTEITEMHEHCDKETGHDEG